LQRRRLEADDLQPGTDVYWLQAIPLHESERRFLVEHGLDALESRWAQAGIEFHDVGRDPVEV
jgi:hypothetical protein